MTTKTKLIRPLGTMQTVEAEKTGNTCTLAAKEGRKPRSLPYGQKLQSRRKEPSAKRQKNLKNAVTASFDREQERPRR